MNRFFSSALLATVVAFTVSACTDTRGKEPLREPAPPAPTDAPRSLQSAHEAYVASDFVAMSDQIRSVLLDPNTGELAKENALELLEKGYEATRGRLPSTFVLPNGVRSVKLAFTRTQLPQSTMRSLYLFARMQEGMGARISDVTVTRLPDDVILDRKSGRGKLVIKKDEPGYDDVVLEAQELASLPADGVFSIRVVMDGAPIIDTWVLGSRLVSTGFPEVESPAVSAPVADANPTVRWRPFRSPEYSAFEGRTLSVYLSEDATDEAAWDFWKYQPAELGEVRIGDQVGARKTALAAGAYWLALTAGEERSFGPVLLARQSQTALPFDVVR